VFKAATITLVIFNYIGIFILTVYFPQYPNVKLPWGAFNRTTWNIDQTTIRSPWNPVDLLTAQNCYTEWLSQWPYQQRTHRHPMIERGQGSFYDQLGWFNQLHTDSFQPTISNTKDIKQNTVDGRNPAPVDRWFIPWFIGFQPSFWWCRISSTLSKFKTKHLRRDLTDHLKSRGCKRLKSQIVQPEFTLY